MNPEPIIGIRTPHGKQHLLYARSGTSIWRYCIFCTFGMKVAYPTVHILSVSIPGHNP